MTLITVFEHQRLRLGMKEYPHFAPHILEALQRHYGATGQSYYSLIHNGVCFNQFVGVLQIADVTIEVLPKIDKNSHFKEALSNKTLWQKRLIDMLLAVSSMDAQITGNAYLNIKANSILDAYLGLFVTEVERLLHQGLIKQYRKQEANLSTLKGRINFSQHIRHNTAHQERFFVEYNEYSHNNLYNQILYKTLKLVAKLNTNQKITTHINSLLLNFPDMADCYVDEKVFERIVYTRKNQHYRSALHIAQLILLNYHPDITHGQTSIFSLMFDMNKLWERFVLSSLYRYKKNHHIVVKEQVYKPFWSGNNHSVGVKPDIVISHAQNKKKCVLDAKWKHLLSSKPSVEDLRQLYVYHHYYEAEKVALVYPATDELAPVTGKYKLPNSNHTCSLLFLETMTTDYSVEKWQQNICHRILNWCDFS